MYDGKQVLRFVNNYKTKDLYLIGNEMNKRIGTGNYDSDRTKFNVHYKDINKIIVISSNCNFRNI